MDEVILYRDGPASDEVIHVDLGYVARSVGGVLSTEAPPPEKHTFVSSEITRG